MKKKAVVNFTGQAWDHLQALTEKANENFQTGIVTYSDIINEIIPTAKIDISLLQAKHTNVRKSLKQMALKKDIDLDAAIKSLIELQSLNAKVSHNLLEEK